MSPFTIFVLCIQALLIQVNLIPALGHRGKCRIQCVKGTATSQLCGCGYAPSSYNAPDVGYGTGSSCGGYGGLGTGEVSAAGKIDACGTTCVKGAVPVIGSVTFDGCADACGSVTICGECGCGCQ